MPNRTASGLHWTSPFVEIKGAPFHVVKHSHNDVFTTYAIYLNNRLYLKPPMREKMGRRAAYIVCNALNRMPRALWGEPPATRDELLAVK